MIDDMTLFVELTVALTAVIIVIRGLPPSGSVIAEIKFKLNFYLTQIAQPIPNRPMVKKHLFSYVPSIILWILLHA